MAGGVGAARVMIGARTVCRLTMMIIIIILAVVVALLRCSCSWLSSGSPTLNFVFTIERGAREGVFLDQPRYLGHCP